MTENTPDRSPDDNMDPDKEARMLLNPPNESVQFSQNATSTNGQVVLPINNRASSGVGMSKAELMKYATDPFWVRLRMFLFILFWVVWLAMLVGAVLIIAFAPGCPATASLPWWKKCALVQINVKTEGTSSKVLSQAEQITKANSNLNTLKENLDTLKSSALDGILLTGLDPFLLANLDNKTETQVEIDKFRDTLTNLVTDIHGDEVKGKIIVNLILSETLTNHGWFKESLNNASDYSKYYIWENIVPANVPKSDVIWDYSPDRLQYYGRKNASESEGRALLNYGDAEMREKMHQIILSWVRTKLDGIQPDGDLWVQEVEGKVYASSEAYLQLHKWVKTGGSNKALVLADSKLAPELVKQGEDATFELATESALWNELTNAKDLKEALKKAFSYYVQLEEAAEPNTTTTKDGTPVDVGQGWRSFQVLYPASEKNPIANAYSLPVAEGVLAAFYLLPKSTPILQTDGELTEQLQKLKSNKFLAKLNQLRRDQSESFLLGNTQLPEVINSNKVFAVSRVYKEKNTYLLLINFDTTSHVVEVKGKFPDPTLHTSKVVLTDSKSAESTVGQEIKLSEVKLEPNQVLLVEFAPKE